MNQSGALDANRQGSQCNGQQGGRGFGMMAFGAPNQPPPPGSDGNNNNNQHPGDRGRQMIQQFFQRNPERFVRGQLTVGDMARRPPNNGSVMDTPEMQQMRQRMNESMNARRPDPSTIGIRFEMRGDNSFQFFARNETSSGSRPPPLETPLFNGSNHFNFSSMANSSFDFNFWNGTFESMTERIMAEYNKSMETSLRKLNAVMNGMLFPPNATLDQMMAAMNKSEDGGFPFDNTIGGNLTAFDFENMSSGGMFSSMMNDSDFDFFNMFSSMNSSSDFDMRNMFPPSDNSFDFNMFQGSNSSFDFGMFSSMNSSFDHDMFSSMNSSSLSGLNETMSFLNIFSGLFSFDLGGSGAGMFENFNSSFDFNGTASV